jgi:hypothetical protein
MFSLTVIATTGERFTDFAPYVASVNEAGVVAFQAALHDGAMGVFIGNGDAEAEAAGQWPLKGITSHPDLNNSGDITFYGNDPGGGSGVFLLGDGVLHPIAQRDGQFASIGPLGPTINEAGSVAFRADRVGQISGIFAGNATSVEVVADSRGTWRVFHGLPVIANDGTVVFRADRKNGVQGIYAGRGASIAAVVETGALFRTLAHFPSVDERGTIAFAATLQAGGEGIFTVRDGQASRIVGTDGAFDSCRGALIANGGELVAIATPRGGSLGLYAGPDPEQDRIIALGDHLLGSEVTDLAANPVSLNGKGQVAVRARLTDGRQLIVRADPIGERAERWMVGGEGLEPPTFSV